jgi:hypothetical protein
MKKILKEYRAIIWFTSVGIAFNLGLFLGTLISRPKPQTDLEDFRFKNWEEVEQNPWVGFVKRPKDLEDYH